MKYNLLLILVISVLSHLLLSSCPYAQHKLFYYLWYILTVTNDQSIHMVLKKQTCFYFKREYCVIENVVV